MHYLLYELYNYLPKGRIATRDDLKHFFYEGNPWYIQDPSCCYLTLPRFRSELIDLLRQELPQGFQLVGETIDVVDRGPYWIDTITHLRQVSHSDRPECPLLWWKYKVCKQEGILIYHSDTGELMTLHEFLLDCLWVDSAFDSYCIGSIFEIED